MNIFYYHSHDLRCLEAINSQLSIPESVYKKFMSHSPADPKKKLSNNAKLYIVYT